MAGLIPLANLRIFPKEDDLGNHQGVDYSETKVQILDMEILQQEHTVGLQRAKEKRQIQEYPGKLPKLMDGFVLQALPGRILAADRAPLISAIA